MNKLSTLIFSAAGLLLSFQVAQAQTSGYAIEALMLSQTNGMGTARTLGLGGSQLAIGADLSNSLLNPAGLGVFNRSEVSISPAFNFYVNDAAYQGNDFLNDDGNFSIGSLGIVFTNRKKDATEGWLGGSFALSYQRTADLRNRFSYAADATNDPFIYRLEDTFLDSFEPSGALNLTNDYAYLGYQSYLLGEYYFLNESDEDIPFYNLVYPLGDGDAVVQQESVKTRGGMQNVSLAYGGNFSDKFYLGASVNFVGVDFSRDRVFSETFNNSISQDDVKSYTFSENYDLEGDGLNATIGIIARPIPNLRLAASYQTPTYFDLHELNTLSIVVNYEDVLINAADGVIFEYISPNQTDPDPAEVYLDGENSTEPAISEYDFNLRTPSRFNTGLAYIFDKYGFFSADVEFVNYGNSRYSDDFNAFQLDNQLIREDLANVVNYRFGAEGRYNVLRFRAGYGKEGDPYKKQTNLDRSIQRISGGVGVRLKDYYVDLGVMQEKQNRYFYPFGGSNDLIRQDAKRTTLMATVGFNF